MKNPRSENETRASAASDETILNLNAPRAKNDNNFAPPNTSHQISRNRGERRSRKESAIYIVIVAGMQKSDKSHNISTLAKGRTAKIDAFVAMRVMGVWCALQCTHIKWN